MMRRLSDRNVTELAAHLASGKGPEALKFSPPEKKKKVRSREESEMQCALLRWWHLNCRALGAPELALFSIPNGGGRSGPIVGSILKAEGLRKGAPDLMLAVVRKKYWQKPPADGSFDATYYLHGLFLELKRKEGAVSPEQEMFHDMLRAQGYLVEVVRDLQQCINIITSYLT